MDYRGDKGAIEHICVEGPIDGILRKRQVWNVLQKHQLRSTHIPSEGSKNSSVSFWRVWCPALLPLNFVQGCPREADSHLLVSSRPIPVTHAILINWSPNGASCVTLVLVDTISL